MTSPPSPLTPPSPLYSIIEKLIERFVTRDTDLSGREIAEKVIPEFERLHPELFDALVYDLAKAHLTQVVRSVFGAWRAREEYESIRAAFGERLEPEYKPEYKPKSVWDTRHSILLEDGSRVYKSQGTMRGPDWMNLAEQKAHAEKDARLKRALYVALAKKCQEKSTAEVMTEDQFRMLEGKILNGNLPVPPLP